MTHLNIIEVEVWGWEKEKMLTHNSQSIAVLGKITWVSDKGYRRTRYCSLKRAF